MSRCAKRLSIMTLAACVSWLSTVSITQAKIVTQPEISLKFITLGTNAGPMPDPERAEPANLLLAGDQKFLIDVGDGAPTQLAKAGVGLGEIHTVLISHLHFDHIGGLFALISQRHQIAERSALVIYGPPGTENVVHNLIAAIKAANEANNNLGGFIPGTPGSNIKVVDILDGERLEFGDLTIRAVSNSHYSATPGGADPHALSLSYRFDVPGRSIVYTGDTGPSPKVAQLARHADLLITEITDPNLIKTKISPEVAKALGSRMEIVEAHFTKEHLSPTEVGRLAEAAEVKSVVLTHIEIPDNEIAGATAEIRKYFKGHVRFANDLDEF